LGPIVEYGPISKWEGNQIRADAATAASLDTLAPNKFKSKTRHGLKDPGFQRASTAHVIFQINLVSRLDNAKLAPRPKRDLFLAYKISGGM
jgi:hypothetical protein